MKKVVVTSRIYQPRTQIISIPPATDRKFMKIDGSFSREAWPVGLDFTLSDGRIVANTVLVFKCQYSLDGILWDSIGEATFPGGIILNPFTGLVVDVSTFTFVFHNRDGQLVARDGEIRFELINLVPFRTAVNLTMYETSDPT